MRLESFQCQIGGNLEHDIWHEKRDEGGIHLVAHQMEILSFKIRDLDILTLTSKQSMQQKIKDIGGLQTERGRPPGIPQIEHSLPLNRFS